MLPTCTLPPADWSLRLRWQLTVPDALMSASTGRLGDTDGDGVTSAADGVGIWLTRVIGTGAPAAVLVDARGTVLWNDEDWQGAPFVSSTVGAMGPGEPPAGSRRF